MRHRYVRRIFLAALFCGGFIMPTFAEPIDVVITPRLPYYVVDSNGVVSGVVADPAVEAFEKAGLNIQWEVVSFKRQLKMIENNKRPVCGIGWFKNPEREKFAKFTKSIYQNKPLIALSRSDNDAVLAHHHLRSLMKDKALIMGRKLGFSYGVKVDGLIEEFAPKKVTTDQSNMGMIRMLIGKRFDYMISSPEEAAHLPQD